MRAIPSHCSRPNPPPKLNHRPIASIPILTDRHRSDVTLRGVLHAERPGEVSGTATRGVTPVKAVRGILNKLGVGADGPGQAGGDLAGFSMRPVSPRLANSAMSRAR
jgi:hypothetical protein